jgi:hypothetical protein
MSSFLYQIIITTIPYKSNNETIVMSLLCSLSPLPVPFFISITVLYTILPKTALSTPQRVIGFCTTGVSDRMFKFSLLGVGGGFAFRWCHTVVVVVPFCLHRAHWALN